MDEQDITFEALSGDAQLTPSDASEAVETVTEAPAQSDALTLAELNSALGKNFTSKDAAIKAYKDTFSFVGKRTEDLKNELKAELQNDSKTEALAKELAEMRKERFFDKNPDLAPYRDAYEKVGGSPEEFFNSPAIKPIIEKAKGYDESQKLRTVLESNPRIASGKDTLSKARELSQQGRAADAEALVGEAILSIYDK